MIVDKAGVPSRPSMFRKTLCPQILVPPFSGQHLYIFRIDGCSRIRIDDICASPAIQRLEKNAPSGRNLHADGTDNVTRHRLGLHAVICLREKVIAPLRIASTN